MSGFQNLEKAFILFPAVHYTKNLIDMWLQLQNYILSKFQPPRISNKIWFSEMLNSFVFHKSLFSNFLHKLTLL